MTRCPECHAGKCGNCTGNALDPDTDELIPCRCPHIGFMVAVHG